jgi:hypothetical protein
MRAPHLVLVLQRQLFIPGQATVPNLSLKKSKETRALDDTEVFLPRGLLCLIGDIVFDRLIKPLRGM